MNTRKFDRYSYSELRAAATSPNAQQIDIDTLGAWFSEYGREYWNGESYNADDGLRLFEIVLWNEENEQGEIVGYSFDGPQIIRTEGKKLYFTDPADDEQ